MRVRSTPTQGSEERLSWPPSPMMKSKGDTKGVLRNFSYNSKWLKIQRGRETGQNRTGWGKTGHLLNLSERQGYDS